MNPGTGQWKNEVKWEWALAPKLALVAAEALPNSGIHGEKERNKTLVSY